MEPQDAKQFIQELLTEADITIDGTQPWDITVHNNATYQRVLNEHVIGLGEAYMDSWWDCPRLDEFFYRLLSSDLQRYVRKNIVQHKYLFRFGWHWLLNYIRYRLFNPQSSAKAFEVGEQHYDIGNDLFECMLDKEMNYTCGYWKQANNLEEAQALKLKLICDKLGLQPGQKVLDIGCGWGSFARYAAKNYGVSVVGVTISKEQKALADTLSQGLPVDIRLQDYRDLSETFDHICSIGMFEHVGYKNYRTYMQVAYRCLKPGGLFLLHTIGANATTVTANPWITKYIFPNGMVPSIRQVGKACERLFVMEDWHNFGADYDKTLMAWHSNFNQHWETLKNKYNQRFKRMWNYYLLSCAGAFRARDLQLWQIVLAKPGVVGGYTAIR